MKCVPSIPGIQSSSAAQRAREGAGPFESFELTLSHMQREIVEISRDRSGVSLAVLFEVQEDLFRAGVSEYSLEQPDAPR